MSQAAVDQSEAEYKAAQAQLAAVKANAGQAVAAQSFNTITAPYAGVVGATLAELGDMAQPGRPLVTVFDPRDLRVDGDAAAGGAAQTEADRAGAGRDRLDREERDGDESDRHPGRRCAHAHDADPARPAGGGGCPSRPVRPRAVRHGRGAHAGGAGHRAAPARRSHRGLRRRRTGPRAAAPGPRGRRGGRGLRRNPVRPLGGRAHRHESGAGGDGAAPRPQRNDRPGRLRTHRPLLPLIAADAADRARAGDARGCSPSS